MTIAPICPYCCELATFYENSTVVYGVNHGPIWACLKDKASVGCHTGRANYGEPLGTLANAELRRARMAAHEAFDPFWKGEWGSQHMRNVKRRAAYQWLQEAMGVPKERCHIGMFDVKQCAKVVLLSKGRRQQELAVGLKKLATGQLTHER